MKKSILIFGTILAFCITGCVAPTFAPKPLQANARGITLVNTTPYGCQSLGETEGSDNAQGYIGANLDSLRIGAYNDLKNEAVAVVGQGKRITLNVLTEDAFCQGNGGLVRCRNGNIVSYRVRAQIFECGKK
ncbi:MAG: DUF4156 domain-containing protein [Campylobacter sp.]|nr:DUF4156 domain-containing protein [Campylobacter sp.]